MPRVQSKTCDTRPSPLHVTFCPVVPIIDDDFLDQDVSSRSLPGEGVSSSEPGDVASSTAIYRYEESPVPSSYPFYQLEVHLHYGKDLLAKDAGGTSDPYVKFKIGAKQLYRSKTISKTLNPVWNEHFMTLIDDLTFPLVIRVFDYDFGFQDDYLGTASIDLTTVHWNLAQEYKLTLTETGKVNDEESWGHIVLGIRLQPKTQEEKDEVSLQYLFSSSSLSCTKFNILLFLPFTYIFRFLFFLFTFYSLKLFFARNRT